MKKPNLFITCILSIMSCSLFGQWTVQNQISDTISLRNVSFTNNTCGWVVGDDEIILKTYDAGVTWIVQNDYSGYCGENWLNDVFFLDEDIGWAVGDRVVNTGGHWGTILHTSNGGDVWTEQLINSWYFPMNGVHFTDNANGWAVCGAYGLIKTVDGGENWDHVFNDYLNLECISFVNESHGWAAGYEIIINTTDGGDSWNSQLDNVEDTRFYDIYFTDTLHGWAVGGLQSDESGIIYSTVNGGETWNLIGDSNEKLYSCFFIDNYCGWIVGGWETVLYTTDGGENWHAQSVEGSGWLHNIFITEDYQGWIAGGQLYNANLSSIVGIENQYMITENENRISNYPSPFSNHTNIDFSIEESGLVNLSIFDITGKQIEVLISEVLPSGEHRILWKTEGLKRGIYFCELITNVGVKSIKMIKL